MADLVFEAPAVKKKSPIHLADLNLAERKERAVELGLPAFRANQLAVHFFTHHNDDVESFTDIPKELRTTIGDAFLPKLLTLVRSVTCDGGRTRKDLWRLHDGVLVESVLMGYTDRTTVCISSQAGCGMQCPFCATGQAGIRRRAYMPIAPAARLRTADARQRFRACRPAPRQSRDGQGSATPRAPPGRHPPPAPARNCHGLRPRGAICAAIPRPL